MLAMATNSYLIKSKMQISFFNAVYNPLSTLFCQWESLNFSHTFKFGYTVHMTIFDFVILGLFPPKNYSFLTVLPLN